MRLRIFVFFCLCMLTGNVNGDDQISASSQHPYEGFTRPFRTARVAASDFAAVDKLHVKTGDEVTENQLLVSLDVRVLEVSRQRAAANASADSRVKSAKVEFELASRRAEKLKELSRSGGGSTEEIQRAIADAHLAELQVLHAEAEQRALELAVEEFDARIQARKVFSPFAGVATEVLVEVGEFVSAGAPEVCTIVDLSWLRTTLFLPTTEATNLKQGMTLNLLLVETNQPVKGIVERIGKVTLADSGRTRIELLIDNPDRAFRSGLRCQLRSTDLQLAFSTPTFRQLPRSFKLRDDAVPLPRDRKSLQAAAVPAPVDQEIKKPTSTIAIIPLPVRRRY